MVVLANIFASTGTAALIIKTMFYSLIWQPLKIQRREKYGKKEKRSGFYPYEERGH